MSQHFFFSCLFLLLLACFVCCDENNSLNNSFSSDINSPSLNSADSSNTPSTVTATTTPTSESITSADSNTIATSVSTASTTTPTVVPTPTAGSNRIWANSSKILITETIGTTFGRVSLTIDFTAAIQGINPYSTLITYGLSYTSAESPFEVVNVPIDPKSSPTIAFTSRLSPFTLHSFTLLILNTSSPSPPIWTTVFSYNTTATFPIWSNTTASTTPLLSASSVTNTSATLSWLSPVLLNGPEPLRYTLSYSTKEPNVNGLGPFSTTLTAPFFTNNPVSSSNYTFTSLSPGTLYNFTLTSSNAGPLNRSSKVLSVQLRTSPSIVLWGPDPPSFSTVLANASTLVVFWSAPLYPQDDKATLSYRAFALIKSTTDSAQDTTGDDSFSYCLLSPNNCIEGLVVSSNQTATFTQLTTATSYKIYIIAYNSLNIPAYSPVIYITRTIAGPPSWGDLKTAVATVYNSTHVYIDWSPGISIANDDPDEIRYKVIRLPDRKVVVDYQNTDLTTLSCFDTNLETYRNYTYVIYAKNSGSFSVESSTVSTNPVFISQSSADDGDESVVQSLPFIIGVSVGGAVFLALVIALGVFCRPFKAKPKKRPEIFVDHAFMHTNSSQVLDKSSSSFTTERSFPPPIPTRLSRKVSSTSSSHSTKINVFDHEYDEISLRAALDIPHFAASPMAIPASPTTPASPTSPTSPTGSETHSNYIALPMRRNSELPRTRKPSLPTTLSTVEESPYNSQQPSLGSPTTTAPTVMNEATLSESTVVNVEDTNQNSGNDDNNNNSNNNNNNSGRKTRTSGSFQLAPLLPYRISSLKARQQQTQQQQQPQQQQQQQQRHARSVARSGSLPHGSSSVQEYEMKRLNRLNSTNTNNNRAKNNNFLDKDENCEDDGFGTEFVNDSTSNSHRMNKTNRHYQPPSATRSMFLEPSDNHTMETENDTSSFNISDSNQLMGAKHNSHVYTLPLASPARLYGEYMTWSSLNDVSTLSNSHSHSHSHSHSNSTQNINSNNTQNNTSTNNGRKLSTASSPPMFTNYSSECLVQSASGNSLMSSPSTSSWSLMISPSTNKNSNNTNFDNNNLIVSQSLESNKSGGSDFRPSLAINKNQVEIKGIVSEGYESTIFWATVPSTWISMKARSTRISRDSASFSPILESQKRRRSSSFAVSAGGAKQVEKVRVAVKILKHPFDSDSYSCEKMAEESHLLLGLNHPNIVKSYAFFNDQFPIMLVMEFLPYFDLCSFLHTCRANSSSSNPVEPTINETLYILYQVSSALVYLARHRIVHNEVAARNCLVGADLSIKLCDFGHSVYVPPNQTTVHVQDNESFLTRWASPEMLSSSEVGVNSDSWQFGMLCYEFYGKGNVPYHFIDYKQILPFLQSGQRLEMPEDCPEELYSLMLETWSWEPEKRPTAIELQDKLHIIRETVCEVQPIRDLGKMLQEMSVNKN